MNNDLCFGQRYDQELGILEPWYTNPAMDVIKQWKLDDKIVLEYGGGSSTIWWAHKAKMVYAIDHNWEWVQHVGATLNAGKIHHKGLIRFVPTHEGDTTDARDLYVGYFENMKVNIVIVDGIHRYECAKYAIEVLKPEILIIDNHQQDYVFICPALDELTKGLKMERYIQPDHKDHEGHPWATAIFYL